ncbi:cell division protein FtsW [Mangrovactinospora gilvigrisea]|uniref:Probable peptidoglycan glycosyltransferase FtsW n=1 Tax=Mangrovactinospora gilvigrisea TaxID=1428644 RepID=A0A1J7CEQ0_9ACTN|nr:putative lipid II flippase FtsW [Mangrovactinospora gilvigrisea]OIV38162.1 cell division protein FtsW [Mangrovactinospora gilvigrisea]
MPQERVRSRTPQRSRPVPRPRSTGPLPRARAAVARLDRPLTAYYLLLGGVLLILALGLTMVFSASQIESLQQGLGMYYYFKRQLIAVAIGLVLMFVAVRVPPARLRKLIYPFLLLSLFLLALVLVPGIGVTAGGNTNWIQLVGPFQLQPSEFAKLALVLWGADLLARKQRMRMLKSWKHLVVPLAPMTGLVLLLVMGGGDMGTSMVIVAIAFALLWVVGAPGKLFTVSLGVVGFAAVLGVWLVPNRLGRLGCVGVTQTGPDQPCWQAVHGIYALASGGLFGKGLGASIEKWGVLPAAHTDFIFAVTGEELGLIGTLCVLMLYAAVLYGGLRVAQRAHEPFVRYAASAIVTWIAAQCIVNIGAVVGLLPIAGVPLPLFSYGGSALLPTMFAVGLLISFARNEPAAKHALNKRGPGPVTKTVNVLRPSRKAAAKQRVGRSSRPAVRGGASRPR